MKLTYSFTRTSFKHFCVIKGLEFQENAEVSIKRVKGMRYMQGERTDTRSVAWEGIKAMKG